MLNYFFYVPFSKLISWVIQSAEGVRGSPGLSVASQQVDKSLNFSGSDVFLQQLAVVV